MSRKKLERDNALLNHVGRHGLSLRPAIERCIFDGKSPQNTLNRLSKEGRLISRKALPGARSYYQLTSSEAAKRGFPQSSSKNVSGNVLERRIAVLWFCVMTETRRHLLSQAEFKTTIPGFKSNLKHCLEREQDGCLISRLKVVSSNKEPNNIASELRSTIQSDLNDKSLRPWIKARLYRYVILADGPDQTLSRIDAIKKAMKKRKVHKLSRISIEFSPTSTTLSIALDALKKKESKC